MVNAELDWVDVLNEQATWAERSDCAGWLAKLLGRPVELTDRDIDDFLESLKLWRRIIQDLHFGRTPELLKLDASLRLVRLGLYVEERASLPAFRAVPAGKSDGDVLRSLRDTLLVQFASFVGEVLAGRASAVINRCEGLYRDTQAASAQPVPGLDKTLEQEWRAEIPVLVEEGSGKSADIQRCADLFIGTRARFCSDACRFSTFQLTKQLKDPKYLAEKQRRYRSRKN